MKNYQEKIIRRGDKIPRTARKPAPSIAARYVNYIRSGHTTASPFIAPETGQREPPDDSKGFREESDPGIDRDKTQFPDAEDEALINSYMVILLEQSSRVPSHQLAEWTMKRVQLFQR